MNSRTRLRIMLLSFLVIMIFGSLVTGMLDFGEIVPSGSGEETVLVSNDQQEAIQQVQPQSARSEPLVERREDGDYVFNQATGDWDFYPFAITLEQQGSMDQQDDSAPVEKQPQSETNLIGLSKDETTLVVVLIALAIYLVTSYYLVRLGRGMISLSVLAISYLAIFVIVETWVALTAIIALFAFLIIGMRLFFKSGYTVGPTQKSLNARLPNGAQLNISESGSGVHKPSGWIEQVASSLLGSAQESQHQIADRPEDIYYLED